MNDETMSGLVDDDLDAVRARIAAEDAKRGGAADAAPAAEGAPAASPPVEPAPWAARLKRMSELGGAGWLDGDRPAPTPALLRLPDGGLFIPSGRVGLMNAPGGTGKSSLLVALAISVATGEPWLDVYPVEQGARGRVLVVMGEEDEAELRRKLWDGAHTLAFERALKREGSLRGLVEENIDILPLQSVPCALLADELGAVGGRGEPCSSVFGLWLRALVERAAQGDTPYRLIILDPLSRFAGAADENDNGRATRLVQELEALCKVSGATVIVAHHMNKSGLAGVATDQGAARGASAFSDGARWALNLEPVKAPDGLNDGAGWGGSRIRARLVKSSYGPSDVPILNLFWPRGATGFGVVSGAQVTRWDEQVDAHFQKVAMEKAKAGKAASIEANKGPKAEAVPDFSEED